MTKLLIAGGANVSAETEYGDTPLHKAVIYKNVYAVELLLEKNVNINAKNNHGESPLYLAVLSDIFQIAKMLVEHGALIDDEDKSPIAVAISNDRADIMELFLSHGVSVDDKVGNNYFLHFAINNGADKVTKLLLDKGADYSIVNENGESLLYMAVYYGNLEIAELIINATKPSTTENNTYPSAQ